MFKISEIEKYYFEGLKSFLEANPEADEFFFISYILKNQSEAIEVLRRKTDFFDNAFPDIFPDIQDSELMGELMKNYNEQQRVERNQQRVERNQQKRNRNEYLFLEKYTSFLNDRLKKISAPKKGTQIKTFSQYLINVEDKGEILAEELKNEFSSGKGLKIRYMIEALKNQKILKESLSDLELYKSMKEYFDNEIGAYSGIFTIKFDFKTQGAHLKYKTNILNAEERIRRILEKLFPAKNC